MNTMTKILVAVLVLSVLFVIVINIVTDPLKGVAGGEGEGGFIGSLWGTSDASLNATCRQKCNTPAPLPDECEQIPGDICAGP